MRQLISRIDDELHRRLKARAAAEGRSLNDLVTEILRSGVGEIDETAAIKLRLRAEDLRVIPALGRRPPSRRSALNATRGTGGLASSALEAERASR